MKLLHRSTSKSVHGFRRWLPGSRGMGLGLLVSLFVCTGSQGDIAAQEEKRQDPQAGVHLFILSGQSNMVGLRPEESFTPTVEEEFGKNQVVVVKDAKGGEPIRRWYKKWKVEQGADRSQIGDLYARLMKKVNESIKDRTTKSVTFVWMQGERDARERNADRYAEALNGVVEQIKQDLDVQEVNVIIGRLSDFDMENRRYPDWTKIREVQVQLAEGRDDVAWVNTDDLNDGTNRNGKAIENDLHYSADGYKTLGKRFAEKAIELINNQ